MQIDQHGDRQRPAEDRRHHHRRRGQRDAERCRAADQEQEAGQRADADVEAPLEVLVGGVDARAREERHHGQRQDHHRQRQRKVVLDEPQAGGVRQAGGADDRDGAHLRRHHRQPDCPPRQRTVREQIAVDLVGPFRSAQAVDDDPADVGDEDDPVERAHIRSAELGLGSGRGPERWVRADASCEHPPEQPERGDDERLQDQDADVGLGHRRIALGPFDVRRSAFVVHNAALRAASVCSAFAERVGRRRPPRFVGRQPRARRAWRRARFPPAPDRRRSCGSSTKCRGLRMCASCASE